MVLAVAVSIALAVQAWPAAGQSSEPDDWWECYYSLPAEAMVPPAGRLVRTYTVEGQPRTGIYEMWGSEIRINAHLVDTPQGVRPRISYLTAELPTTFPRNGAAIFGYLFADGRHVASTTLIDGRFARMGFAVSNAFFQSTATVDIGTPLAAADRWTVVVVHADGTEALRRELPVADRRSREEAFVQHLAAVDAAWEARDRSRLVSTPAASLPPDRAVCLLSTAAAREEMDRTLSEYIQN